MLTCFYTDPPDPATSSSEAQKSPDTTTSTASTETASTGSSLVDGTATPGIVPGREDTEGKGEVIKQERLVDFEITNYVLSFTWSGDGDQAARKLEFEIAYNIPDKDKFFRALDLKLGGFIYLKYNGTDIFEGRIFYRKRNTGSFTYSFTCYDDMIYLAKSQIQKVFDNISVSDAINAVCSEIGITVSSEAVNIPTVVNFIADGKTCTEVFQELFEYAYADTGTRYTAMCLNGDITVVEKGTLIDGYIATDLTDVGSSEHSESIEDMVNCIKAVDDVGNICQVFTAVDDVNNYGMIQQVYKMQPPMQGESVDNVAGAKAMLKQLKDESSIHLSVGWLDTTTDITIQCISGYSVQIQEEQLQGKFFIKSDTHRFANNAHEVDLTLEYLPDEAEEYNVEQQDIMTPVFKSSKPAATSNYNANIGSGNLNVDAGLSAGYEAFAGTTMDNGTVGCCEAVRKIGSYYSPFLYGENYTDQGPINWVPTLMDHADAQGLLIPFSEGALEKGDVIVYEDGGHVMIYDGSGIVGNSSTYNCVTRFGSLWDLGQTPTHIIKSSRG